METASVCRVGLVRDSENFTTAEFANFYHLEIFLERRVLVSINY